MNAEIVANNYHFIRPEYLYLLVLLPLVFIAKKSFLYFKHSKKNQVVNTHDNWMDVCRPEILNSLYISNKNNKSNKTHLLLLLASVIMIFALAGPTWSKHDVPLYKSKASWVIVLSLAESMQNTDVTPTRLQRAKYKIQDFLNLLTDEQLALIIYTNSAFNLIPLTSDKKTIDHILPSIDPLIMPVAGDDINAPLEKILNLRQTLKLKNLNVLILTDGNANSQSLLTAKKFDNININIINFNKTHNNDFNNSLSELSSISNGLYQDVSNNDDDLKNILQSANTHYQLTQEYEQDKNNLNTEVWHDMGPYLLFLILPLIVIFLTKSRYNSQSLIAFALINALALSIPTNNTYATSQNFLNKLWYSEQQLAAEQLKHSNIVKPEVFKSPTWQAAAFYKDKNYDKSIELLQNRSDVTSLYNYANSLAQQGNIPAAIENYKKVLQSNPNHSDAKFNKDLLEKYQKDKSQQNQNQKNQNQENQQKQEQNKNSNQDQQDQQDQQSEPNNQKADPQSQQKDKKDNQDSDLKNDPEAQKKPENAKNNNPQDGQKTDAEQAQANKTAEQQKSDKELKQWLNKIPDNPAIYLRNQLQYEYWKEQQQ